jgi:cytochrome c5
VDIASKFIKKPGVRISLGAAALAAVLAWPADSKQASAADKPAAAPKYATDIKPILEESCVKCHRNDERNPRGPAGGLLLSTKAAILKGGKSGKAVVLGKADDSLLIKVLSGPAKVGEKEVSGMPKPMRGMEFTPLADEKIELIKKWINSGAQ